MIKQEFPRAFVYKAADKFRSGIPDLLICLDGMFCAIELKTLTGKTSRIQDYTIAKIAAAGGRTAVARSVEEVRATLWQMKGGEQHHGNTTRY